jgi:hypothetical protein
MAQITEWKSTLQSQMIAKHQTPNFKDHFDFQICYQLCWTQSMLANQFVRLVRDALDGVEIESKWRLSKEVCFTPEKPTQESWICD